MVSKRTNGRLFFSANHQPLPSIPLHYTSADLHEYQVHFRIATYKFRIALGGLCGPVRKQESAYEPHALAGLNAPLCNTHLFYALEITRNTPNVLTMGDGLTIGIAQWRPRGLRSCTKLEVNKTTCLSFSTRSIDPLSRFLRACFTNQFSL